MTGQRQPPAELTIGVVGPHDLVERVMLSGAVMPGPGATPAAGWPPGLSVTGPGPARRLVAATYRGEQEAPGKVLRLGLALHTLVEEGLAWPLPPARTPQPGRPRQFYRIITEKLARPSQ
jgi:hypothetical protein